MQEEIESADNPELPSEKMLQDWREANDYINEGDAPAAPSIEDDEANLLRLALAIAQEVRRAQTKHPSSPSFHHALAVIREEYLELEREVFTDGIDTRREIQARAREEAQHLAASAMRLILQLDSRGAK